MERTRSTDQAGRPTRNLTLDPCPVYEQSERGRMAPAEDHPCNPWAASFGQRRHMQRPSPSSPVQAEERVAAASCFPSFYCSSPSSASSRPPFPDFPSSAAFGRSSLGYPSSRGPMAKPVRQLSAADLERGQPRKPFPSKSLTRELP